MSSRALVAGAVLVVVAIAAGIGAVVALPALIAAAGSPAVTASPTAEAVVTATPSPTPAPTVTPTPTAEPTPTPAPTPLLVPAPLTGLPVDPSIAARHVVAVMIDDQADARPQSGLASADVVWQAPAEGGIPRYMAFFQSVDPPSVGPVRSSRVYFIGWAAEWNAVYVHVGGSTQAMALLASTQGRGQSVWNADEFRWGGAYLWRIKQRFAPHNVYTDAAHLQALAAAVGAPAVPGQAPAWRFGPDLPLVERPDGGTILVPYLANRIEYAYDRTTNTYLRTVTGEGVQVDAGTKTRIAPKNVLIMTMAFAPLNDGSGKGRLEAAQVGSGRAWIATGGRTVQGTWRKDSFTAPTLFFGPDGLPVILTAGQTFVQVVPLGTAITIADGVMRTRPALIGRLDPEGAIPS